MSEKKTIFIQQRMLAFYRLPIYSRLASSQRYNFVFVAGKARLGDSKEIPKGALPVVPVRNVYFRLPFLKNELYWQKGLLAIVLSNPCEAIISGSDPYNTTFWVLALICKVRRIPLILWSIGVMEEEKGLKRIVRDIFLRSYDRLLLYGDSAREQLIRRGFDQEKVVVIYNSVEIVPPGAEDQEQNEVRMLREEFRIPIQDRVIIHLGTLTRRKKIEFLIDAIRKLRNEGKVVRLFIIGEGEQRGYLNRLVSTRGLVEDIILIGEIFDEKRLSLFIRLADLTVLPGNGGLAVIHSLAYGTPVLVHNNITKSQGPEAEAIVEGKTGGRYREDDIDDMVRQMKALLYPEPRKKIMKENCQNVVRQFYTSGRQEETIYSVLEQVIRKNRGGASLRNGK